MVKNYGYSKTMNPQYHCVPLTLLSRLPHKWMRLHVTYTERQKKHHFFRTTLTKIQSININHNYLDTG